MSTSATCDKLQLSGEASMQISKVKRSRQRAEQHPETMVFFSVGSTTTTTTSSSDMAIDLDWRKCEKTTHHVIYILLQPLLWLSALFGAH